jgi:outer membrane protein TolC
MVWTLNDLGSSQADAKSTASEVARVRAQKQQFKDGLRTEVLAAHRSIEEADLGRESARRGIAAAQASYEDRVVLLKNGRGTALEVLEAETSLVTARLNLVEAHVALRMARVRLDHALGRDVDAVVKAPRAKKN